MMTIKVAAQQTVDTQPESQTQSSTDRLAPLNEAVRAIIADSRVRPQRYLDEVIVPRSAGE